MNDKPLTKPTCYLGFKLALPFEDYFDEFIPEYYSFLHNSLFFVPYNLFLSVSILLNEDRLLYSKEVVKKHFTRLENAVFKKSVSIIEYLFDNLKIKKIKKKVKPEDILNIVFSEHELQVDIISLKEDYAILAGDIESMVRGIVISTDITNNYGLYLKYYEEEFLLQKYFKELNLKLEIQKSDIPTTSKELIFALFKFIELIGDIKSYNFKLKETIKDIILSRASNKYPIGGYSEISSEKDEPERLLYSELIYMGEEIGKADLFSIKYLENDLLYLKRDNNSFHGSIISFIFDLTNVRLFIKDKNEFIPEYLLIFIFIKSVIRIVNSEISEMRTYFILKGVPENIQSVVRYFLPEGVRIEESECPDDIKQGISIYTVFNGKIKNDIKYDIKKSIIIDEDKFGVGKTMIRLFDKRSAISKLRNDKYGLRIQIQENYVEAIKNYFKFLKT